MEKTLFAPDTTIDLLLEAEAMIPVNTGMQVQGDVAFIPAGTPPETGELVTSVPIVEGTHTHQLVANGDVRIAGGVVTVGAGAVGFVIHEEHAALGLGAGSYKVVRQVEGPKEARRQVAD